MSVIYLKNPQGGAKVAISEAEAVYDESLGWKRFVPGEAPEPAAPVAPEPVAVRKPRGRPRKVKS